MKRKIVLMFVAILALASCTRIDAGHEGILVKQYGSGKGVQDATMVTGRVWYNPFTEDVIQYPVYFQTADYEAFTVNAKDGSIFNIDPMLNYRVIPTKSPMIFVKYRKNVDELQKTVILTYVKDVFKNVFNTYTTDDILSKRQQFDAEVTKMLSEEMVKEGFEVGQMTFGMVYPKSINQAIELKTAAMQVAQQKETELRVAKANAEILITNAKAEAEANKLRQQTLNSLLIQQQFIEKWDGKTAIYGNAPSFFKSVN